MLKNIIKNFSALILSQLIYKLLSFFAIAYVARQVGDAKFGQLSFALYLSLLFFALSDMGLSEVYICEVAGNKAAERDVMGGCIGSRIIFSIAAFLILIGSSFLFAQGLGSAILILLIGVSMTIDSVNFFVRSVFRAREQMEYEALSLTLEGCAKFFILVLTVKIFKTNLLFIGLAFLITSTVTFFITAMICRNNFIMARPVIKADVLLKFFKKGLPFAIIGFLSIISLKIDTIMLAKMTTDFIAGWYSAVVRLLESALVIPVTLATVLFPVVARLYKNSKDSFLHIYGFSLAACAIGGLGIAYILYLASRALINLIFGQGFINSIYILQILSPIIIPMFFKLFLERAALAAGKIGILLRAYIGGVILKVMLNILFIPLANYKGAALTTIFIESAIVIFVFFSLNKYLRHPPAASVPQGLITGFALLEEEE